LLGEEGAETPVDEARAGVRAARENAGHVRDLLARVVCTSISGPMSGGKKRAATRQTAGGPGEAGASGWCGFKEDPGTEVRPGWETRSANRVEAGLGNPVYGLQSGDAEET
jgi:hypothetical protein